MSSSNGSPEPAYSPATLAIHADDHFVAAVATDVAPPVHLATTFDYDSDPDKLIKLADRKSIPDDYVYSRLSAPNTSRLEVLLSALLKAPATTYSSGLSAVFAAYTLLRPRRVAITGGYHGCYGVLAIHSRLHNLQVVDLDCKPEDLGPGDVIHVETPVNPTGEARNLAHYSSIAKARGAYLFVDATFGPPSLQDPFDFGADIVMHSGTKYIGGHSDMLCGVLATRNKEWNKQLLSDRLYLGSVMGSLEGWLGLRSMRTLEVRVATASRNAETIVTWLHGCLHSADKYECVREMGDDIRSVLASVSHASVQAAESEQDKEWIKKQMPGGYGPVFAVMAKSEEFAKRLPSKLKLFHHATSLGSVESLVEWRAMSDTTVDTRLLRFSIGVEGWEDLQKDIWTACKEVAAEVRDLEKSKA